MDYVGIGKPKSYYPIGDHIFFLLEQNDIYVIVNYRVPCGNTFRYPQRISYNTVVLPFKVNIMSKIYFNLKAA